LIGVFGRKEIELDIELLIDEVEKMKLINGKSIDLRLNERGKIFNFHKINLSFIINYLFYIIKYSFFMQILVVF